MKSVTGRSIVPAAEYTNAASSGANDGERYCIVCGNKGTKVFATTMRNHVDVRYWSLIDDTYRFSTTPGCNVVYYSNAAGIYFLTDEVKTPCALKETDSVKPVCYCMGITEDNIKAEILGKACCDSLEDIEAYTRAGTGKWCFVTNPSGKCCRDYLPSIVDKFLKQVKEPRVRLLLADVASRLSRESDDFTDITLSVQGMTCESCAVLVKEALKGAGADSVLVSLSGKTVTAKVPEGLSPEEAARAVTDAGFEAVVTEKST
ncbi:MAG: (2Fe-2S)-binding protein [Thermoplasmata archaeon]|nr:(2Fe-2S)-binding protein [Candidatus Sysuiplasma acidicola]MBX8646190.1 (2Fe-2S)-binding protein [Candidatus Sysuiplasma acidicola]